MEISEDILSCGSQTSKCLDFFFSQRAYVRIDLDHSVPSHLFGEIVATGIKLISH